MPNLLFEKDRRVHEDGGIEQDAENEERISLPVRTKSRVPPGENERERSHDEERDSEKPETHTALLLHDPVYALPCEQGQ